MSSVSKLVVDLGLVSDEDIGDDNNLVRETILSDALEKITIIRHIEGFYGLESWTIRDDGSKEWMKEMLKNSWE